MSNQPHLVSDLAAALDCLGDKITSADMIALMTIADKMGMSIGRLRAAAAMVLYTLEVNDVRGVDVP